MRLASWFVSKCLLERVGIATRVPRVRLLFTVGQFQTETLPGRWLPGYHRNIPRTKELIMFADSATFQIFVMGCVVVAAAVLVTWFDLRQRKEGSAD